MLDVVALGELLIDFAPQSVNEWGYPTLAANPGGAPGNFLAALNKYGCKTAMIGKVGDDMFGRLLIGTLEQAGILSVSGAKVTKSPEITILSWQGSSAARTTKSRTLFLLGRKKTKRQCLIGLRGISNRLKQSPDAFYQGSDTYSEGEDSK